MGTANFLNRNAYKTYAIDYEDEYFVDMVTDGIYAGIEKNLPKGWEMVEVDEWNNERSYPAKYFAEVYKTFKFYGVEVEANIKLCLRAGYYTGGNFDYDFEFVVDGSEYESIDEVERDFSEYARDYAGKAEHLLRYHLTSFIRKLEDEVSEVENVINKIYEEHTTPLCKVAQFSNGEAFYEVCKG